MIPAATRHLLAALGTVAVLVPSARAAEHSPAGRTMREGRIRADASIFESASPVRSDEKPPAVVLFDQSKLPSAYKTPWVEHRVYRFLKIVRPYDGASFPRNTPPPKISWEDETDDVWMLSLKAPGWAAPLSVITDRREWRPDAATWEAIKRAGTGGWITLELRGCAMKDGSRAGDKVYLDSLRFRVSEHSTDPLIVYRFVTPLFHGLKTPDIFSREVSSYESKMFLPGAGSFCTNCHSFPIKPSVPNDQIKMSIAVRRNVGDKAYKILGIYDFASRKGKTLNINSFFMGWNPDGTKIAVTGGDKVAVRPLITLETQEFYVLLADILIVDARTLSAHSLPGASDGRYMETLPTWSADGETIVFARAPELANEFAERKFNLYKVPYNNGQGGIATPIPGASHNGLSNYAARFSPDGKWLAFNKADYSSLVAPTSDLWILSTEEGAMPRELDCNVPYAGDSHHSWSSNSRWLLFASKRDDGIFARIYITEIDEHGRASPPVELPCLEQTMFCYNVPEFVKHTLTVDAMDILEKTGTLEGRDAPPDVAGGHGRAPGGKQQ